MSANDSMPDMLGTPSAGLKQSVSVAAPALPIAACAAAWTAVSALHTCALAPSGSASTGVCGPSAKDPPRRLLCGWWTEGTTAVVAELPTESATRGVMSSDTARRRDGELQTVAGMRTMPPREAIRPLVGCADWNCWRSGMLAA